MSAYSYCPYLCGVTGPEQSVLIGTDRSENWNRKTREDSNKNVIHTKRVNEEVVLDLVHVPRMGLALQRSADSRRIVQKVHLPTGQANIMQFSQYVVGPGTGFRKMKLNTGGKKYYRSAAS